MEITEGIVGSPIRYKKKAINETKLKWPVWKQADYVNNELSPRLDKLIPERAKTYWNAENWKGRPEDKYYKNPKLI